MADETKTALLDAAQELVQTRGYNAFSFRDVAKRVGIRAASVHHHFPSKGDLGVALLRRYHVAFESRLEAIERLPGGARRKFERFVELFRLTLKEGDRLCLCGMLATEYATLPPALQREVRGFFRRCEGWLANVLEEGRRAKEFRFLASPAEVARSLFSALEGAMISARAFGDPRRLAAAGRWLVESLTTMA